MLNKLFAILFIPIVIFSCTSPKEEKASKDQPNKEKEMESQKKVILFFGNSLTAGYGIELEHSFVGLVAQRIDSLDMDYRVINAGLSGETTASGLSRLEWFLEEEPDIFVLELGANDGLRGITLSETKKNLKAIIQTVRTQYPETTILLAGMQIPPNMGQEYIKEFQEIYPAVALEENVELIPFLLEGVAGNPDLNLPDGIHPTEEGHLIVFDTVWKYLEDLL
ncbi:arylesterase [Shivajiella indica]|uniref:Arylesterase n=1 Tax=Shivajiella indica TaxID=872115 RepID=A0ABW5B998_9BACT